MTTSGSSDFSTSRDNIIKDALLELKALRTGESPTTDETTDCARALNMMVKHWQIYTNLWPTKDVQHTLTPGTESYTVGTGLNVNTARPLRLLSCRREDSSGNEVEIDVVSREEYKSLPTKNTQQPANMVYYDPQLANGVLYVWPTGTTGNILLNLTFQRPLEDFDATSDTPDFPQEWYLALVKNLAVVLYPQFKSSIDFAILKSEAANLLAELRGWDQEQVSVFFGPEHD